MELHQLRYFVAIAELRSFTRAAERCRVSQPSLSQQIIKLERELGQPLFERLGRSVRLTEPGEALLAQAQAILRSVNEIQERVVAAVDPQQGKVSVGAIPTIAPYLLPPLLKSFRRQHAGARVSVHENLTDPLLQGCLSGEVDVAVIASPPHHDLLCSEALFTEELRLATARGHRLLKGSAVALRDLAAEPFVLMNELHCLGEQVLGFCRQEGCEPQIHCQSVQLLTIQELVAQGQGVSLIPSMACESDRGRKCSYRSLTAPTPTRTIRMVWHRDRYQSPLLKRLLQAMRGLSRP
ncbi:MAG: LysR family transcriptional regulator [Planctomyces sp.]|nr:LysR family transcriptional regulator [Planctomyces sp.]